MEILIIGAGGVGLGVMDAIEKNGKYEIAGFIVDTLPVGSKISRYEVLGTVSDLSHISNDIHHAVIAVGDNWQRSEMVQKITGLSKNLNFVSVIHPTVCIGSDVKIGDGSILLAGAIVASNAIIGKHSLLAMGAILGHHSELRDYASILGGATVAGNVRIGEYSCISLGANVINKVSIGQHSIIGAGATVVSDIPSNVVAFGTPATVKRSRQEDEKYL